LKALLVFFHRPNDGNLILLKISLVTGKHQLSPENEMNDGMPFRCLILFVYVHNAKVCLIKLSARA